LRRRGTVSRLKRFLFINILNKYYLMAKKNPKKPKLPKGGVKTMDEGGSPPPPPPKPPGSGN
jgi:hypothetical protein